MSEGPRAERRIVLKDEADTERLAETLALVVGPGTILALSGDLGAGKTALARALLRALHGDPGLEVPSPTFTLVQPYPEGRIPAAHADLYRIADPAGADELDLAAHLADGLVIVEWPERGGIAPGPGVAFLAIAFGPGETGRTVTLDLEAALAERFDRALAAGGFLAAAGWSGAHRRFLAGDASARRFERIARDDPPATAVLMDAPRRPDGPPIRDGLSYSALARLAEDAVPFVAVGNALAAAGLSAPAILAHDLDGGFLLVEDLGDATIAPSGRPDPERYRAAVDALALLHETPAPAALALPDGRVHHLPAMDADLLLAELELWPDWYLPFLGERMDAAEHAAFRTAWADVLARALAGERHMVLRDFHSPNLLWLPDRAGARRVGVIDFQDALLGPVAYDLASLVQDARVTVPAGLEAALVDRYVSARAGTPGFDETALRTAVDILAAQRAMRILGTFVRLDRRDGKPRYLAHLPRLRAYLARHAAMPALAPVSSWLERAARATT